MGTVLLDTVHVQVERVVTDLEAALFGDLGLPCLNFRIIKLFDAATLKANEMIVMAAFVEFKNRFSGIEVVPFEQAGLLKLGKHAVDRRQSDIHTIGDQQAIDILRRKVAAGFGFIGAMKQLKNLEAGNCRLQAAAFQVVGIRVLGFGHD